MRGTKIGISTLVVAGFLLAGCSSGDDTTTPETSSSSSEPAPDDSTSEEESEGGGEASGDLVDWASDLCGAIAPLEERLTGDGGLEDFAPTDPADTGAIIDQMREAFSEFGPAFSDARDAVEDAGPPPIDGGDEAYENMLTVLGTAADAFSRIDDELAALDPDDPNALAALEPFFTDLEAEMGAASEELDATFSSPEMEAAFDEAPGCEGLDMTTG